MTFQGSSTLALRKCFGAGPLLAKTTVALALIASGRAANLTEMQAFVFPQVSLGGGETVQVCGANMSEAMAPVEGLIAVVDATDTTKLLGKTISFSLASGKGNCVNVPSVLRTQLSEGSNVIVILAFQNSTTWNATVGKAFISSLLVKRGGSLRAVLTPLFIPAIQVPVSN
jgi:hypothetical protein